MGRAGLEKHYDAWLRGMPGYKRVAVDSMGRVLGDDSEVAASPGDTLVTSIDAKVQSVAEKSLHQAMMTARKTFDPVTHRNYVADSGAVVVMDAHNGRVVAMSSQPTYDPKQWVGGISSKQLKRLYSAKADNPLLFRATQGQFAPGSTWKPLMAATALSNGFAENTLLDCSSGVQVGNRWFKNYESASYGPITFAEALQISCDSFFYRVGLKFWSQFGRDPRNVNAKDPLVSGAKGFGMGSQTGIDIPGESSGRIADRHWKLSYWKAMKGYYCKVDKKGSATRLPPGLRARVLPRGQPVPPGRRGQLLDRPGRHPGHAGPARPRLRGALQRRHALRAPRGQGRRLAHGRGGQEGSRRRCRAT